MTWLQDTQGSLMEKASRAEDFYSHMLLRRGFRNWLKVFPHHSGEMIPSEPVAAVLSPHHTAASHICSPTFAELHGHHPSNIIPSLRDLLSSLHSPSFFFTQDTLLHLCTLSPCSLLIFLRFCPHYASRTQLQHHSVPAYWAGGWEKEAILTSFSVLLL